MNRTISLIERYLEKSTNRKCHIENLFDINNENLNLIEQLINASNGNMRRLVHLLDMTMNASYKRCNCKEKISIIDVNTALKEQAQQMEVLFTTSEKALLADLVSVCKTRNAYKFSFPNRSVSLTKYANKSSEYNIINVLETGTGRKGSIYEFDYAYCVYRDIPTHYLKNTDRLDKTRSRVTGERIKKVTKITDSLIEQAVLPGKIEGQIIYINKDGTSGVVKSDDDSEYVMTSDFVIKDDRNKKLTSGKKIRFIPVKVADLDCAIEIELL